MSKIKFDILTLFPDFFSTPLKISLLGKAVDSGLIEVEAHNIRDSATDPHHSVDDTPYGGGEGMVMRVDVLAKSLEKVTNGKDKPYVILLDPAGGLFNQKKAQELTSKQNLVLVCGRYEGVDQRFKSLFVDEEVSIGDYVLNGGEAAALVVLEAVSRLVPGVVGKEASTKTESFSEFTVDGEKEILLEYPHYTKPVEFRGQKVPEILLSGDHRKIQEWRLEQAKEKTSAKRPDLKR
jgi:tRNA (guanine37-N1)-methyltransferase